jgi:hypothetical protein
VTRTTIAATAAVLAFAITAFSDTIHVDCDGGGDYLTIQEGVDAATEGDTVLVAAGVYTGASNRNIDFAGRNLVLVSAAGPDSTVIEVEDLGGTGIRFHSGEDTTAVFRGFTIIHADTAVAIHSASPVIDNCVIRDPVDSYWKGPGIHCQSSAAFIRRTQFLWGPGYWERAGLECEFEPGPTIAHCTFTTWGQAIQSQDCSPTVRHCEFIECYASGAAGASCTGGSPVFKDCLFRLCSKSAPLGARCIVMRLEECRATLERVLFDRNADHCTACLYVIEALGGYSTTSLTLDHVAFWGNKVWTSSSRLVKSTVDTLRVSRCTFVDNDWANLAISVSYGIGTIEESIIAYNGGTAIDGESITTTHSCVFGNAGGDSLGGTHYENLFTDPLFCDHESGDLTLRDDSPCLPANNPWGVQIGAYGAGDCGTGFDEGITPGQIRIRGLQPNPAGSAGGTRVLVAGPPGAEIEIRILDLRGRLVRTLAARSSDRGEADYFWDHRDARGIQVASGVYFAEASGADRTCDGAKIVVLR